MDGITSVEVLDAATGAPLGRASVHVDLWTDVSLSPSGVLAVRLRRGWSLYDWRADRLLFTTDGSLSVTVAVAVAPDGTLVAVADEEGTVKIWEVPQGF